MSVTSWDHVCCVPCEKTASPGQPLLFLHSHPEAALLAHKVLVCRASFYHTDTQCIKGDTKGFGCHPTRSHCSPWTKLPFAYDLASNRPKPWRAGALYFKASFIIFNGESEEFSRWRRWSHWSRVISESASCRTKREKRLTEMMTALTLCK